jgi:GNAT superfamily N-acetyltransferase
MSLKDLAFEPAMSFLQDANASQYLLPAALLGMVRYKRPGVSAAARDAAEKYHHAPVHDPIQVPLTPNVAKAELLKRRLDPEEEMMLYHSGTADIDESIRQNWLQPQTGDWVKESLAGAVDDPEFAEELARGGAVWMSAVPDWVKAKVARKVGKHVTDVTPEDIRQHGQLTMIRTEKDAPIVRRLEDDDYVENLRGQKQRWWESDLYDYDKRREIPYGVERGDYFAVEDIEPSHTLTGQDLINFLTRNYPATLSDLAKKNRARFGEHPASMSLGQMAKGPVPLSRAADIERVTEEFGKSGSYSWAKNGWNWAGDGRLGYGETKLGNYARRRVDIPDGVKVNRDASGDLHSIEYWKDGMQVGMLDITDRGVSDIAVIPPMQRQGIGSQLLQAAIDNGIQSINTPSISEAGFGLVKKVTDTKPLKQSKK